MNEIFDVLYWYSSSVVRLADPLSSVGRHSVLMLDLFQADVPVFGAKDCVLCSIGYGYEVWYVHCWALSMTPTTHCLAALRMRFQRGRTLVGHTPSAHYTDVMVAMMEVDLHRQAAWGRFGRIS